MGRALGAALLSAGYPLTVWNRSSTRCAPLIAAGAVDAADVATAAQSADLVIVCLIDHAASREVFATHAVGASLAGRTVLQCSFSDPDEALEMERWVRTHGGDYLHAQIKAYPREIGTAASQLILSGSQAAFARFRPALAQMGEPTYLGADVARACVVSNAAAVFYESIVAAFFEAAAYSIRRGASLTDLIDLMPTSVRLATEIIEYSARQLADAQLDAGQASIDTHASSLETMVEAMAGDGREPKIARATLDYLHEAQREGLGALEIVAVCQMLSRATGPGQSAGGRALGQSSRRTARGTCAIE